MNIIKIEGTILILLIRKIFVIDFNEIRVLQEIFKTFKMQPKEGTCSTYRREKYPVGLN